MMECKLLVVLLVLTLIEVNRRSFVDTAPLNDKPGDEIVTELEDLKRILGDKAGKSEQLSFSKTRTALFVDQNGQKSALAKAKSEVDKNGKLVAKIKQKMEMVKNKNGPPKSLIKTEVEIPSKGIYDVTLTGDQPAKNDRQKTPEEKPEGVSMAVQYTVSTLTLPTGLSSLKTLYNIPKFQKSKTAAGRNPMHIDRDTSPGGMEYSPLDMAEYIYWTGDEKNVALMIEEFLEKGIMSRQEAINYLQSIKFNLDLMQTRDKNVQKIDKKNSLLAKDNIYENSPPLTSYERSREEFNKLKNLMKYKSPTRASMKGTSETDDMNDGADSMGLYKEYSLEEIIYQLAKVMFSQSLNRGSVEAQTVLHKLVTYLQKEVKNGQVSTNLQRKLLDVLFAALTDTLLEQTESMVAKKEDLLNLIEAYSPTSETGEQLYIPNIGGSLGNLNSKQRLIEKKNGTKTPEPSKE